jgi:hypothetical protein
LLEENPDIFVISEHGLTSSNLTQVNLENYVILHSYSREKNLLGGVAIFGNVNSNISDIKILDFTSGLNEDFVFESACIKITLNGTPFTLGAIYRSPNDQNLDVFFGKLNSFLDLATKRSDRVLIAGDFNINTLCKDSKCKTFKNSLSSFGLSLAISTPTRVTETSSSCLDNFITNFDVVKCSVISPLISDHDAISVLIPASLINKEKYFWATKRELKIQNLNELKFRLSCESWDDVRNAINVNDMYNNFLDSLSYNLNVSCPLKKQKIRTNPGVKWVNEDIHLKKSIMFDHFKNFKESGSHLDKLSYERARLDYRTSIQNAKLEWMETTLKKPGNKSKQAWTVINKFRPPKNLAVSNLKLDLNGSTISKPSEVCEVMNSFFVNVAEKLKHNNQSVTSTYSPRAVASASQLSKFKEISKNDLENIFSKFSPKTSAGVDGLSMMILKHCRDEIIDPLLHIINQSIREGIFPDKCKLARIKPIFKKGDVRELGNWRPISILPALSKILERVVCEQLTHYLEDNNLFCKKQYGFRKNKSTKLALIDFVNQCIDALEAGETVIGCFADLSKAFDCVDAQILSSKLMALGIQGLALEWLNSFMKNRRQFVEIEHRAKFKIRSFRSSEKQITSGVPQGSILGPILFLIYINDMSETVSDESLFLFADDTTLFTKDITPQELEVQTFIKVNQLAQYFSDSKLSLNASKTGYLCIQTHQRNNRNPQTEVDVFIGDERLEPSDSIEFLGVRVDGCLSWADHIEKLEKKLSSGLFVLRRTVKLSNSNLAKLVYFSLMESHIVYSIVLWGSFKTHLDKIFTWQKKAVRAIFKLPPWEHCSDFFKKLGILTVPCLYIFELIMYIKNQNLASYNQRNHQYNTRFKARYAEHHRLSLFERKPLYSGLKIFQSIPPFLLNASSQGNFKLKLKRYLLSHNFYTVDGFIDHSKSCNPACKFLVDPGTTLNPNPGG